MLFSIVTPTLNASNTLPKMLLSIQSQEFRDFEHLIVDGGSTDCTVTQAMETENTRVISGVDSGIFDAMNKGIGQCQGEWIYFLGADDFLADSRVLRDVSAELLADRDVVYGDVRSSRFGGRYDGPFDFKKIRKKNMCHQAIFFRRDVFEKIGQFNLMYKSHADWDHNMRWILNNSVSKHYIDRVIAVYADGGFSSMNPDRKFERDRLYRYLTYGKSNLPLMLKIALRIKEVGLGIKYWDMDRVIRMMPWASE